jgi:hypothetical protein
MSPNLSEATIFSENFTSTFYKNFLTLRGQHKFMQKKERA